MTLYIKYHKTATILEEFQIFGQLRFVGLNDASAHTITTKIIKKMSKESSFDDPVSIQTVMEETAKLIVNKEAKKIFARISNFYQKAWNGELKEPLFIFIGGSSTTGKDTLATALKENLGIDRLENTDNLRERVRVKIRTSYKKIPKRFEKLFQPTYIVGIKGFKQQCAHVNEELIEWIKYSKNESKTYMHPIYIVVGINLDPRGFNKIRRITKNSLFVMVDLPREILKNRIIARQERELGKYSKQGHKKSAELADASYKIQEYLLQASKQMNISIIKASTKEETMQKFAKIFAKSLLDIS
jgi:2-phosphoglycerate kinase